jgi:hypothetical protein
MKKHLIILFFLTSMVAIGQTTTIDKPPKKTWKILIKNSNSKEDNYKLIGQTLIDNDFSIEKRDIDYLTLETTPKATDDNTSSYYLKFVAKDNLIVLTGMGKSLLTMSIGGININNEYSKIRNIGMRGSVVKEQFNSMLNFAKLFIDSEFEFIAEQN